MSRMSAVEIVADGVHLVAGEDFRMVGGRPVMDRPVRNGAPLQVTIRFYKSFICERGYADGSVSVPWWKP